MGDTILERLRRTGHNLYRSALVSTRSGNLSFRVGEVIVITKSGALLGNLEPHDLIEVPLDGSGPGDSDASPDLVVHREIYARSEARAVVHAHPPATVALTFRSDAIEPRDHEGRLFIPKVAVFEETRPRTELAARIAGSIASGERIVAVRAHGVFAAGDGIEAAEHWTTCLELSSRILLELGD